MIILPPGDDFLDYIIFDEEGYWKDIRDDAPEEYKKAFKEIMENTYE